MEAIDKLCKLFGCEVGELLEFVKSEPMSSSVSRGRHRAP
jgi:DNA-binding Xre family transcriptional regulator